MGNWGRAAGVVAIAILGSAAPAGASVGPCTPQYEASIPPALEINAPSKLAYGRRVGFSVQYNVESPAHYVTGTDDATPATLTMQSDKGKPFGDTESEIAEQEYYLEPERSEGSKTTITLAYDELSYEPEGSTTCRRSVTRTVRYVAGEAPTIVLPTSHGADSSFKVKTFGENCALTKPGRVTLTIYAPEKTGKLSLSDPCDGRWTRRVSGSEWELEGGLKPSPEFNTEAEFSAFGSVPSVRHFAIVFAFRGHQIARVSFEVSVTVHVA
jgi:hypothetical protein